MLQGSNRHAGSAPPQASTPVEQSRAAMMTTPEPFPRRGNTSPPGCRVRRSSRIAALNSLREDDSANPTIAMPRRTVSRPSIILTDLFSSQQPDVALPSIEGDATEASSTYYNDKSNHLLSAYRGSTRQNHLQTPEPMNGLSTSAPNSQKAFGESISRAGSAFSVSSSSSSSSGESQSESMDRFSVSGSTTSPETEASTPFGSTNKRFHPAAALDYGANLVVPKHRRRSSKSGFTKSMDQHLWATFMKYLENPQMAPFAMRPGQSPPGGVQHLVARQARRTWQGGERMSGASHQSLAHKRSSDTLVPTQNSSAAHSEFSVVGKTWPSKTVTRARLRELCREQQSVTPHMQQRLKSRSPTPVTNRSRAVPRPSSHNIRFNSLSDLVDPSAYSTRDVRLSLAASTSSTMRRNGPLAQLATHSDEYFEGLGQWFRNNNDITRTSASRPGSTSIFRQEVRPRPQHLGSPFRNQSGSHHTWGPGMAREVAAELSQQSENFHATAPRLRSPLHMSSFSRPTGSNKRRAPSQLEDPLATQDGSEPAVPQPSNVGEDDPFGPVVGGTQRRVRSRGVTLSDIFAPRVPSGAPQTFHGLPSNHMHSHTLPGGSSGRPAGLASPFDGITARPTRNRTSNHRRESLQVFADPQSNTSIDSRLERPDCKMADSY